MNNKKVNRLQIYKIIYNYWISKMKTIIVN